MRLWCRAAAAAASFSRSSASRLAEQPARAFEAVARALTDCGERGAALDREYGAKLPSTAATGAERRFGPGLLFARTGLNWSSTPWPYALTRRDWQVQIAREGGHPARGSGLLQCNRAPAPLRHGCESFQCHVHSLR